MYPWREVVVFRLSSFWWSTIGRNINRHVLESRGPNNEPLMVPRCSCCGAANMWHVFSISSFPRGQRSQATRVSMKHGYSQSLQPLQSIKFCHAAHGLLEPTLTCSQSAHIHVCCHQSWEFFLNRAFTRWGLLPEGLQPKSPKGEPTPHLFLHSGPKGVSLFSTRRRFRNPDIFGRYPLVI